jgi:sugar phosphate isomerase/epimerase
MKLALREDMSRGGTLAEQLAWLEGLGFEGIELCAAALDLPPRELEEIFADSPVRAANIAGSGALLDPDPAERTAAKELMRRRLDLAATLGAVGLLTVPQFGSAPRLPDLSPYKTGAELEKELFVQQLQELAPAARDAGVPIFLEPLNRYEQHLVNRLEQGVAFAEQDGRASHRSRPRRRQQSPPARERAPRLPSRLRRAQRGRLRRIPRHRV